MTDFGLAKAADQQDLTHTGDVLGTLRYMAPEQFNGKADARSDVYSLGLTLYEMLALKPAFNERDRHKLIKQVTDSTPARLRTLDPHIPRDLETVIHKAIDRDPSHRYQTAGELAADLQRYLGDEPIKAKWVSPVTRFTRWCKRNPLVAGLTTMIALLLIAAAIGSSLAAVNFQDLADEKATLADDLAGALDDAEKNLTLATKEQQRAEGNLDLALVALDAVYLDAIGTEKLLGGSTGGIDRPEFRSTNHNFSELEKDLIRRGLGFYEKFAERNQHASRATSQMAQAHYRVALLYAGLAEHDSAAERYEKAISLYRQLVDEDPENVDHLKALANAYYYSSFTKADWSEAKPVVLTALDVADRAVKVSPNDASAYEIRGLLRVVTADLGKGLEDFARAVTIDPQNAYLHGSCSFLYANVEDLRLCDYQKAVAHGKRAVELRPDEPGFHQRLAQVIFNGYRDAEQALEHVERALKINPDYIKALDLRARIYLATLNHERALEDVDRVVRLSPESWRGYHRRARIYLDLGEFDAALADIVRAEELVPHSLSTPSTMCRGQIHNRMGDYQKAIDVFTRGIERSPTYCFLYRDRALAYESLEDYEQALKDLSKAVEYTDEPGQIAAFYQRRGRIRLKQQQYVDAISEFEQSLKSVPHHVRALQSLSTCQLEIGQPQAALQSMSHAIEVDPFNVELRRSRARIAWDLQEYLLAATDRVTATLLTAANTLSIDLSQLNLKGR